ncbi:MAG: CYTH domain-containing protein [Flavobacteriales bacterium]
MAIEIERKFLINKHLWEKAKKPKGEKIMQAYLSSSPESTVRVRSKGNKGYLTVKGKSTGISRVEYEYEIPISDVKKMINTLNLSCIEKIRYEIKIGNHIWEIDEFHGENSGLIVAEIELSNESELFEKPIWILDEVSDDIKYYNSQLLKHPFKQWKK